MEQSKKASSQPAFYGRYDDAFLLCLSSFHSLVFGYGSNCAEVILLTYDHGPAKLADVGEPAPITAAIGWVVKSDGGAVVA